MIEIGVGNGEPSFNFLHYLRPLCDVPGRSTREVAVPGSTSDSLMLGEVVEEAAVVEVPSYAHPHPPLQKKAPRVTLLDLQRENSPDGPRHCTWRSSAFQQHHPTKDRSVASIDDCCSGGFVVVDVVDAAAVGAAASYYTD